MLAVAAIRHIQDIELPSQRRSGFRQIRKRSKCSARVSTYARVLSLRLRIPTALAPLD